MTCEKWMEDNLFLRGVWIYYCLAKPENGHQGSYGSCDTNMNDCAKIFKQLIDRNDEIGYYSCNMLALCLQKNDPLRTEYFNIAAEHGIDYAHINLAENLFHIPSIICHLEVAASKHNRYALLRLAKIYLVSETQENWQLSYQYYQTAMKCGYGLGDIDIVLTLKMQDSYLL